MAWNPSLYLRHGASRLRPALDLLTATLSAVESPSSVRRILDLGCGPGNITGALCQAYPEAQIVGVDSSPEMIAAGKTANPDLLHRASFELGDMNKVCDLPLLEPYDLVYSNAALHWTPDQTIHKRIVLNLLKGGGVLAVQMPDTRRQPSHLLMEEAAKNCGFSERIAHTRIPRVEYDADYYYNLLSPHCTSIDLWSTEYTHLLSYNPSGLTHPVAEFTSATGLQPIVNAIRGSAGVEGDQRVQKFLKEYNRLLLQAYPPTESRTAVLFPFKRFFFIATRR